MDEQLYDWAYSEAKRYDHGIVLPFHVLSATLKKKKRQGEDVGWLIKDTSRFLRQIRVVPLGSNLFVSDSARFWLEKATYWLSDIDLKKLIQECEMSVSQVWTPESCIAASPSLSTEKELRELPDLIDELESLAGLEEVKSQVKQLIANQEANKVRAKHGKPTSETSMNLVFSGPPGTGKTTVARLISEIYKAIGLLESGHLIEAGRSDLVAPFVGQTSLKTREVLESALDGVLFIDEAYSLSSSDSQNDYGKDAVAELIAFMENNRQRIAVIVAGYSDEMENFISSNPGLRSRFSNFITFKPYDVDEMMKIFHKLAENLEIEIPVEIDLEIRSRLERIDYQGELGNARYIRELFSKMCTRMNSRAFAEGIVEIDALNQFSSADIPPIEEKFLRNRKKANIGFAIDREVL